MRVIILAVLPLLTSCQQAEETESSTTTVTTSTVTSTVSSTSNTMTTTTKTDECSDYRMQYPKDGYGTSVGSVMADFPGMVDGDGNPHNLDEFYTDTSKHVLVIANAFDT